jgi:ABC-2 type transport system permease protein
VTAESTMALATRTPAGRARMVDLFAAEWIKFRSLRSTAVTLAALVAVYLYLSYRGAQDSYQVWQSLPGHLRPVFDPAHGVFGGPTWMLAMIVAGAVGAMTVTGEHSTGLIRATFTAVPARRRVAAAKCAVTAAALTVTGAVIAAGSFAINETVLSGHHVSIPVGGVATARLLTATSLLLPLCALAGMALGTVIRNTPATIVAVCVLFVFTPFAFKSASTRWTVDAANAMPFSFWARLTVTGQGHLVGGTESVPAAWTALAVWLAVSAVIVISAMGWRDV